MLANEAAGRKKRYAPTDERQQEITRELERLARYLRLAGNGDLKADTVKRDRSKERRRKRR